MEPEGSLPRSHEPTTCPYPKPDPTSTCLTPISLKSILILTSQLCLGLPSGLLPSALPTKTLYTPLLSPIRATCTAHLSLLDFITPVILGKEHKAPCYVVFSTPLLPRPS